MKRRSLLGWSLTGGTVLALGGSWAAWWAATGWNNGRLLPAGRGVMAAVARVILDGSLPETPAERAKTMGDHLERLEALLNGLPPHAQTEIARLLAILAVAPLRLALTGLGSSWERASLAELQVSLQSMRTSSLLMRRQVYGALRDLTHAAYFSNASTWPLLGYPGPREIT
jgi:hypothetical protein